MRIFYTNKKPSEVLGRLFIVEQGGVISNFFWEDLKIIVNNI